MDLLEPVAIDPLVVHQRRAHAATAVRVAAAAVVLAEQPLAGLHGAPRCHSTAAARGSTVTRLWSTPGSSAESMTRPTIGLFGACRCDAGASRCGMAAAQQPAAASSSSSMREREHI